MFGVRAEKVCVAVENGREILTEISFAIAPGSFTAILGENGAGKTTLLDTIMGFRRPHSGRIMVDGLAPANDNYLQRREIAYLSEKVDMPADWTASEFLAFNRFFYPKYQVSLEAPLLAEWGISPGARIVNLSAGEIRRVQIVAALCQVPRLFVIDEIAAVLDIVGRRKFMATLKERHQSSGATILFATNILEDLNEAASHILILKKGRLVVHQAVSDFMKSCATPSLADGVAARIEQP